MLARVWETEETALGAMRSQRARGDSPREADAPRSSVFGHGAVEAQPGLVDAGALVRQPQAAQVPAARADDIVYSLCPLGLGC